MPKTNEQRANTRYGADESDADLPPPPGAIEEPGGMMDLTSRMAPRGVPTEKMRPSTNVERADTRTEMESGIGAGPSFSDEDLSSHTSDELRDALHKYLKGKIKPGEIEDMFPYPSERLRGSQLAADLGVKDVDHAYALGKLYSAFRTVATLYGVPEDERPYLPKIGHPPYPEVMGKLASMRKRGD